MLRVARLHAACPGRLCCGDTSWQAAQSQPEPVGTAPRPMGSSHTWQSVLLRLRPVAPQPLKKTERRLHLLARNCTD